MCRNQCGTNVWIFEYIQIYLDKYIHLPKYSLNFFRANMFNESEDIEFSLFSKNYYIWSEMIQFRLKKTQHMKMAKIL